MQRRLKSKRNHEYSADELVGLKGSRFVACQRLNYGEHNEQELVAKSRYYIEKLGVPVVISDVPIGKGALEPDFFTLEWLCRHYPDQEVPIILPNRERAEWTWDKFSNHVMRISNSKTRGPKRRAYAHDVDCPKEWDEAVKRMIPDYYHYMGPSDLMRFLPDKLRAKNLMTYVGMGQTQTPGHVDMCGTMGHNLMVYSVQGASALWFMVARDDKQKAAKFWHAETGGNANLESESCFMDIDKLCRADFNIYVLEQKVGDFVLLPSDTVHQVINRGDGYNVKVSWNRSSCHNMPYTFNRMLPRLRKIFKVEAYRCKAMAHKAMEGYADAIENAMPDMNAMQAVSRKLGAPDRAALAKDFGTLIKCVVDNLATEWISENGNSVTLAEALNMLDSAQEGGPRDECVGINISKDPMPFERRCNFCNCDIWNRRFHCPLCVPEECEQANIASESLDKEPGSGRDQGEAQEAAALLLETDDGEDLCIACYAYGRTCQEHPDTMLIFESFDMRSMLGLCARAVGIYRKLYESLDPQSKLETANLTEENLYLSGGKENGSCMRSLMSGCHQLWLERQTDIRRECHSCGSERHISTLAKCAKGDGGDHYFCVACMYHLYNEDVYRLRRDPGWICPRCKDECSCDKCNVNRRLRIPRKEAKHPLYPLPAYWWRDDKNNRGSYIDDIRMDEFLARTNGHDQVDRSEKSPPSKRALEPGTDEHPSKKQVVRDQPAKPTDVGQEREVRSFLTEYCFVNTIQTLAQARPQPTEGEQLDLDLYARMMRSYLYLTDPANNFGPDVVRTFEEESVRRYGLGRKVAN